MVAPSGAVSVSAAKVPIEDSPVIDDLEPHVKVETPHDHIYDNFPKGKLCKDNCAPSNNLADAPPAPTASATLSEGTNSQEPTVGRQFIRNESLTGDIKEIGLAEKPKGKEMDEREKETFARLTELEKNYPKNWEMFFEKFHI